MYHVRNPAASSPTTTPSTIPITTISTTTVLPLPPVSKLAPIVPDPTGLTCSTARLTNDLYLIAENGKDRTILSTWDFGGQRLFYTVHHLFLTKFGVYLVVFSMANFVSAKKKGECLGHLRTWLNSVSVHAQGAPVLLIGTFKDQVKNSSSHLRISEELLQLFSALPCFKHVVRCEPLCFFPVDNTCSSDPLFSTLRLSVEQAVHADSRVQAPIQLTWLALFDKLRDLAKVEHTVSFATVAAAASLLGMVDDTEVADALLFFHDLGYIVFYNDARLRNLIILEPQWIINRITAIIRDHSTLHVMAIDKDLKNTFPLEWSDFVNEGKVSAGLLQRLWAGFGDFDMLVALLCRFGLLVPLNPPDNTIYLVPSLVAKKAQPSLVNAGSKTTFAFDVDALVIAQYRTRRVAMTMPDLGRSFLPSGLFDRLLGQLIAWVQTHQRDLITAYAKDWICGVIGGVQFLLINDFHHQMLRIETSNTCATVLPPLEVIQHLVNNICSNFFKSLHFAILMEPTYPGVVPGSFFSLAAVIPADPLDHNPVILMNGSTPVAADAFIPWVPSQGKLAAYDIFLSYRRKANAVLVDALYRGFTRFDSVFGVRRCEVFYDNIRLEPGSMAFDVAFAVALRDSIIFVPVISMATLANMLTLDVNTNCDNVLLEWWLCLVFRAVNNRCQGRLTGTMPLVCHSDPGADKSAKVLDCKKAVLEVKVCRFL